MVCTVCLVFVEEKDIPEHSETKDHLKRLGKVLIDRAILKLGLNGPCLTG